jgi:hypothetical protein
LLAEKLKQIGYGVHMQRVDKEGVMDSVSLCIDDLVILTNPVFQHNRTYRPHATYSMNVITAFVTKLRQLKENETNDALSK